jgi:hypothetical protein
VCPISRWAHGMNRSEFEELRDMPSKRIIGDIVMKRKKDRSMVFESGAVAISSDSSVLANVYLEFNEATGAKTVNVMVVGVGPICRLDVDGKVHRPAGRCHKHALHTPDCPADNLPRAVIDRPDLSGQTLEQVFAEFCSMAHIEHTGNVKLSS